MNPENIGRRKALENTAALVGGILTSSLWTGVLAGCEAPEGENWAPKFLNPKELELTKVLVDVLIPRTETPGASDALVHRFIDEMLKGYLEPAEQLVIRKGINALNTIDFLNADNKTKIAHLETIAQNEPEDDPSTFFRLIRSLTLLGYFTSELGATQALAYDPIPGAYEGCIPLDKYGGKTWAEG